ncbi:hypothetical protein Tco_0169003 [Tanacetum coccineum]
MRQKVYGVTWSIPLRRKDESSQGVKTVSPLTTSSTLALKTSPAAGFSALQFLFFFSEVALSVTVLPEPCFTNRCFMKFSTQRLIGIEVFSSTVAARLNTIIFGASIVTKIRMLRPQQQQQLQLQYYVLNFSSTAAMAPFI